MHQPTAQIIKIPTKLNVQVALVESLLRITQASTHSYEMGMHRLLRDVMDLHGTHVLTDHAYHSIIGTAIDVLFFFNYDSELLADESNAWYRASIIHQIGSAMLQAIERVRPDLTSKPFFREAIHALSLKNEFAQPAKQCAPVHCKQWTPKQ